MRSSRPPPASDRPIVTLPKPRGSFQFGVVAVAVVALLGAWKVRSLLEDPDVFLLLRDGDAEWIRAAVPFHMGLRRLGDRDVAFRTKIDVAAPAENVVLHYRAFRRASVFLNGELIDGDEAAALAEWKTLWRVDLTPKLAPGRHELEIRVSNRNGHPVLLAYCEELGLGTGADWEASVDGENWTLASSAHERADPAPLSENFPTAGAALGSRWFVFAPIFLAVFLGAIARWRPGLRAAHVRWGLVAAWVVMCANNTFRLPVFVGFDVFAHVQYIHYIAQNGRLPFAPEGWEMFQAPLYHLVAAGPYYVLSKFFPMDVVIAVIRVLSMLCGVLQVELVYRAVRSVYRDREDLQTLGLVVGALLPMNVYLYQGIGNEPMHGLLSSAVIVIVLGMLHRIERPSLRQLLVLGFVLGLTLLTKVTAVLLLPFVALTVFVICGESEHWRGVPRRVVSSLGAVFGVAFLVSGWYYLRNFIGLGKPFTVGWDPSLGVVWWQDPGYRTVEQLASFGVAVNNPLNAGLTSFWDGFYSTLWTDGLLSSMTSIESIPPWNYSFMLAGAWLALVPTVALVVGLATSFTRSNRSSRRGLPFAAAVLTLSIMAVGHLFLTLPFSCTGKASFTSGITTCYAVVAAGGFDLLTRHSLARAGVYGVVACWAVSVVAAYFVV